MAKAKIHQIKIDFNVTEQIKRFVYVYIIEAKSLYMIDSGVCGCQEQICDYLRFVNRDISELKGIFLTHAHPDHIGSAAWFREQTGCRIYASEGERRWIEDIHIQFKERPIPNFYKLAGKSSKVDVIVKDGDVVSLENDLEIKVLGTAGHSQDGVSYLVDDSLFIGDSVPVKGDIPIFINEQSQRKTLDIIRSVHGINAYYPAWDKTYSADLMQIKLNEAAELMVLLKSTVTTLDCGETLPELTDKVCDRLNMPALKLNPLFQRTIECLRQEN